MSELTIRFAEPNEAGLVLDFIKKIAVPMDEWTTFRLSGEALKNI